MRKTHGNHGHLRVPAGELPTAAHPSKAIATNAEILEEILQDAGLEDLSRG